MSISRDALQRWRADPVVFVRENFGVEPDEWQVDALRAFANPKIPRLSLQACAGPGKTALLAWCGWNFISCYGEPGEHPKGVAVAITSDNLKANLWPEFSKWQLRSKYLSGMFTWSAERIFANDHKPTWFLEARSWPKTASQEEQGKTLSGLHGKYVLALIDESGAIPKTVLRAAEQALSTGPEFGKLVQSGNPISRDGMLYAAASELADQWHVIRITGDPDDPKRSPRIPIDWAQKQIRANGRDDPWVKAYILGEFPAAAFNALLSPDEVRDAMKRAPRPEQFAFAARILGVDVGREGDDASVIFKRQGLLAAPPIVLRNVSSTQGGGRVAREMQDWQADACFVDNTGGFGGGWVDQLRVLRHDPVPVHFSSEPLDRRYLNKRAEMWFAMAQWVKEGGALPDCPELIPELTECVYGFKGDRLKIEDKDQLKARLGRSPDRADALALTFAFPVARRTELQQMQDKFGGKRREYDPHELVDRTFGRRDYDPHGHL